MPRIDVWDLDQEVKLDCGLPRGRKDHYQWGNDLGKGGFGEVKLVTHVKTGRQYACKCIAKQLQLPNVSPVKRQQHLDNIKREAAILRKLRGTLNVVYLEDAFEDDSNVYLVMEWCKGGELIHAIGSRHYSERTVASFMRAVLRTLAQCHAHKILHRDIKPGNFMLLNESERSAVKAIDFGLAVFFDPQHLPRTDLGLEGTPWYMAPEVLSSQTYPQSDVWAAGVMAFQLLSGKFPFDDWKNPRQPALSLVWRSILTEEPNFKKKGWDDISDSAKDFVKSLLLKDPSQRPDAKTALQHPWLQGNSQQRSKGKPLSATIVQKLQRFGQVNVFKRTVLDLIASEVLAKRVETWKKDSSRHGGSLHGPGHSPALGLLAAAGRVPVMAKAHSLHGPDTTFPMPGTGAHLTTVKGPTCTSPLNWSVHGPADVDVNKAHDLLQSKTANAPGAESGDSASQPIKPNSHQPPSRVLSWSQLAAGPDDTKSLSWSVHGGMAYKGPVKNPEAVATASLHSLAQTLAFRRIGQKAYGMQLNALKAGVPPTQDQLQLSPELRQRLEQLSAEQSPGYGAGGSAARPGTSPQADISLMYWAAKKQREEQQKVARLALDVSSHANSDYQKYLDDINGVNTIGSRQDLSRVSVMPPDFNRSSTNSIPDVDPMDTSENNSSTTPNIARRIGKAVQSVFKTLKPQAANPTGATSSLTRSLSGSNGPSKTTSGISTPSFRTVSTGSDLGDLPQDAGVAGPGHNIAPGDFGTVSAAGGTNGTGRNGGTGAETRGRGEVQGGLGMPNGVLGELGGERDELTKRRSMEAEESGRRGHNKYASFIKQTGLPQSVTQASQRVGSGSETVDEKAGRDDSRQSSSSAQRVGADGTSHADNGAASRHSQEPTTSPAGSSRPSIDLNSIDIPPLLAMMSSPTAARGLLAGLESPPLTSRASDKMRVGPASSHSGLSRLISDPKMREETDKLLGQLSFHANENISKEQFQHTLSDLGYQLEDSELDSLMGIIGKAGEDNTLNRAAFIASQVDWADFQNNYHTEWLECLHKAFEGLDTDNDGRIKKGELVQLLADRLPEEEVNVAVEDALMDVAAEEEGLDFEGFMSLLRINSSDSLYSLDQYDSRNACWGSVHGGDLLKPLKEEA